MRAGAVATFEGVNDIETEQDWVSWQGREGSFHDGTLDDFAGFDDVDGGATTHVGSGST